MGRKTKLGEGSLPLLKALENMKVSVVITVLNEEKTIGRLLASLARQTQKPDEIIIVDGGSNDRTVERIKDFCKKTRRVSLSTRRVGHTHTKVRYFGRKRETSFAYYIEKGANRAQGRNLAIKKASGEIIAITDAGCILAKDWLKEIVKPFKSPKVEVVAGYYQGKARTVFEKCVVPYVLIMSDKVDSKNFLPASRSMAIRKRVWQKAGGFPEKFFDNEDYVFAQTLKKAGAKIVFSPKAIVYWLPCSNLKDFFIMIFRFARGDAYAGLRYKKMASIFARYVLGVLLISFSFKYPPLLFIFYFLFFIYFLWSIAKNYRYVRRWQAIFNTKYQALLILPILQIVSDLAVMGGFILGIMKI